MPPSKPSSETTAPSEASHSLGAAARRAVVYVLGGFGASTLLRLVGNLALTRLLVPEAFGMMSLIMAVLIGLTLFSDLGIRPSVVQSERGDDPLFLDTAWTLQVGRGVLLWIVALVLAQPFAALYGEPRLVSLLMVAGTSPLVTGFMSTKLYSADRHLDQRKLATLELTAQLTGLIVMLSVALAYRDVWALVIGSLTTDVMKVALSHLYLKGQRNRFRVDRTSAQGLLRFGRWIFLSTMLTFCVNQSDRLVFGLLVPLSSLGFYHAAASVAALAPVVLNGVAGRVIFPVYSRVLQQGGELAPAFARVRRPLLLAGGWALSGLVAGGPAAISLLYPDAYFPAGWILQLLAAGAWFSLLASPYWQGLLAKGMSSWMAGTSFAKVVAMAAFIPLGYMAFGFPGAVGGYAAADLGTYLVSVVGGRRIGLSAMSEDAALCARFAVAALVGNLAMRAVGSTLDLSVPKALATFVAVSAVWLPPVLRLRAQLLPARAPSRSPFPFGGAH